MIMYKTHEEVKQLFIAETAACIIRLNAIDEETTYTNTEPEWWLDMMALRSTMAGLVAKHKTNLL